MFQYPERTRKDRILPKNKVYGNAQPSNAVHGLTSLPSTPETIALYIASCVVARLAPATIARRLASISKAHQAAGFENSPASTKHFVVGEVLKGARRTLGVAQKCKDPLLLNDICRLLAACPKNLLGLRDT